MWLESSAVLCGVGAVAWGARVRSLSGPSAPADKAPSLPGPPCTLFKPVPPTHAMDPAPLTVGMESFLVELRPGDQCLFGLPADATDHWRTQIIRWREQFPGITLDAVDTGPSGPAAADPNPKIAKLRLMAPAALHPLWIWSDADITAAPGCLDRVRAAHARSPRGLVTHAYLVTALERPSALADAAVANLQLNPGLKFLSRRGRLTGAVGALAAFDRHRFHERCGFDRLAGKLADDHELGRALQPLQLIESPELRTNATGPGWGRALRHAWRWQRTIHWCDPRGSALQIFIHPLVPLVSACLLRPGWTPVCLTVLWCFIEALWAGSVFRRQGVRVAPSARPALLLTAPLRTGLWLAAWLPLPVFWGGRRWMVPEAEPRPRRSWRTLLAGTGPWLAWWVLAPLVSIPERALAALAVWWIAQGLERLELKGVDAAFAVFFLLQLAVPEPDWGLRLNLILCVMAAGSLVLGRPFTLAYAREETEPAEWEQPGFRWANRIITGVWTAAFATNTVLASRVPSFDGPPSWVAMALVLGAAGLFTKLFPRWYRARMEAAGNAGQKEHA